MKRSKTVIEHIQSLPPPVQKQLKSLRVEIRRLAPEAQETISYGIPTFKLNGNLVHFAGYETHIGFYPTSSPMKAFAKELTKYDTARGTIRFPVDKPLPMALIRKIVKFRLAEGRTKIKSARKK